MAYVTIVSNYNTQLSDQILNQKWLVDLNFATSNIYESYIRNGFIPGIWENKNKNKILISGIPYKEYLNNKE